MRWLASVLLLAACHRPEPRGDGSAASPPAATVEVLFVGDSYTFVNDLPAMTTQLVASATPPVTLKAEAVTVGGASLRQLWETTDAQARIATGHHRFVVIQGKSVEACTDREEYVAYAHRFAELAAAHGATPILYATWPRRTGNEFYAGEHHPHTQREMVTCLRDGAVAAAGGTKMTIANVRDPWTTALAARPELVLYAPDGSHPSPAGTLLAANVLARILAPDSTTTWHPAGVTEADAAYLAATR